ncbi:MAG: hypothetical protein HZB34_07745 [Nitrospirae bacterium]|nr:hypothetical protein [Nitrospirota bacterium]
MKQALAATKTLVNTLRHHKEQPLRSLSGDALERWLAIVANLLEKLTAMAKEIDSIDADPKLTDRGKQDKLLALGPKAVGNVQNLGNARTQAAEVVVRLEQLIFSLLTSKPAGDVVVTFLREDAIRRGTPKEQAAMVWLEAINRGDLETARALLDWPGSPVIPDDILRRGKESYALRVNPVAWEQLQYVNTLKDNLSSIAQQFASWLLLLGASPESVTQATGVAVPPSAKVMQMDEYLKKVSTATAK